MLPIHEHFQRTPCLGMTFPPTPCLVQLGRPNKGNDVLQLHLVDRDYAGRDPHFLLFVLKRQANICERA